MREELGVAVGDEVPTYTSVNGNPARSKETPHVRVQAMMAYELMRAGLSCAFWIESRDVRRFDSHRGRAWILNNDSQPDQLSDMNEDLWDPLKAFVARLKATECPGLPGRSLYQQSTIVLASEMGRTIQGDVESILNSDGTANEKYLAILEQDVCQHWPVNSVAFLGGDVDGGKQWGGVGSSTLDAIPLLADGTLDPAFDPATGVLRPGQQASGFVPDAGHVYSSALALSGVDPTNKGRNQKPALAFLKRPG